MEKKDFNNEVITRFTSEITDLVFQYIQKDEDLMSKYLDLISKNTRQSVNASLGKAIAQKFAIDNAIDDNGFTLKKEAKSILIKTKFTEHKLPE